MRIITLNVNSIHSAGRKGFFTWMQQQNTDISCIQETKTQLHQLNFDPFFPANHHRFYHGAEKKDSSGLALYCRNSPIKSLTAQVVREINTEDRFIEAQLGDLTLIPIYLPFSSSEEKTDKPSRLNSWKNPLLLYNNAHKMTVTT